MEPHKTESTFEHAQSNRLLHEQVHALEIEQEIIIRLHVCHQWCRRRGAGEQLPPSPILGHDCTLKLMKKRFLRAVAMSVTVAT